MNIDFGAALRCQENFLEYIRTENTQALRAWKNLGPVSPQKIYREAFYTAVHDDLVQSLLYLLDYPHFYNQSMYNDGVIAVCLFTHSQDIFDLLYPLCDADTVRRTLLEDGGGEQWIFMHEQMERKRLHALISNAVSDADTHTTQRVLKI